MEERGKGCRGGERASEEEWVPKQDFGQPVTGAAKTVEARACRAGIQGRSFGMRGKRTGAPAESKQSRGSVFFFRVSPQRKAISEMDNFLFEVREPKSVRGRELDREDKRGQGREFVSVTRSAGGSPAAEGVEKPSFDGWQSSGMSSEGSRMVRETWKQ